jgi:hypothetical protein
MMGVECVRQQVGVECLKGVDVQCLLRVDVKCVLLVDVQCLGQVFILKAFFSPSDTQEVAVLLLKMLVHIWHPVADEKMVGILQAQKKEHQAVKDKILLVVLLT